MRMMEMGFLQCVHIQNIPSHITQRTISVTFQGIGPTTCAIKVMMTVLLAILLPENFPMFLQKFGTIDTHAQRRYRYIVKSIYRMLRTCALSDQFSEFPTGIE